MRKHALYTLGVALSGRRALYSAASARKFRPETLESAVVAAPPDDAQSAQTTPAAAPPPAAAPATELLVS